MDRSLSLQRVSKLKPDSPCEVEVVEFGVIVDMEIEQQKFVEDKFREAESNQDSGRYKSFWILPKLRAISKLYKLLMQLFVNSSNFEIITTNI